MIHFNEKITKYIKERDGDKVSLLYQKQEELEGYSTPLNKNDVDWFVPRTDIGEGLRHFTKNRVIGDIYGKRIIMRIANECLAHCRYCFKRDEINNPNFHISNEEIDEGIAYIKEHSVRDVILSGGEPLILADEKFLDILERIYSIDTVKQITLDTNIMATNPNRLTDKFLQNVKAVKDKYRKQLIFTIHFTHKKELTPVCKDVLYKLQSIGAVLRSHTPMLKGINDDAQILHDLFEELVSSGVHPYYLIHFIATKYNKHFELPLSEGLLIYGKILATNAGTEIPSYVVYTPTGKGKIRLLPYSVTDNGDGNYILMDKFGDEYHHKDYMCMHE